MDYEKAVELIISTIKEVLENSTDVLITSQLIGGEALVDSMQLVEICLSLEDVAEEHGFDFDWASDTTMSRSKSMFRSVEALVQEFVCQSEK